METKTKIYIAVGVIAFLVIGIFGGSAISNHRITKLEREANEQRAKADAFESQAAQKETESAEYKQKIDYLESQVDSLETIRRQQDEKLQALQTRTSDARSNVARARGERANDTTVDELCRKLASLGHSCN